MITQGSRTVRWILTAAALALSAVTVWAQTLSAPSLSNASTPNLPPPFQLFSDTQTLSTDGSSFESRYFGNLSAQCDGFCGFFNALASNYTVSWTATAPNIYQLRIDTRRTAGLTVEATFVGIATMGALSCTPSGGTLVSGDCTLADAGGGSAGDVNVEQTNALVVCGQSLGAPQNHSVNFQWVQTVVLPPAPPFVFAQDYAAVRLGASNLDSTNPAADYPGIGGRVQSIDGHFVLVTITNLCGNGVIDSCGTQAEECDAGAANGTAESCCTASCTLKTDGETCTDGVFCNGADTCQHGACSVHAGDPCVGGPECNNMCNEPTQNCQVPAGVQCTDDGNTCTDDQCDGAGACAHSARNSQPCPAPTPCYQSGECVGSICQGINVIPSCSGCTGKTAGTPCNDSNACTQEDVCLDGACVGHPIVCEGLDQCHDVGLCDPITAQCSNPARPRGSPCTAPNGKASTCDGQGACQPPGICGNGVVEPPAETCEPDQGVCCVPAGLAGECQYRGPTEQCGQETRKCHTQYQCTERSPTCPTDQPNLADPGTPCLDDDDPDCVLSNCDGSGSCQAVARVCMASASGPKHRARNPTVLVNCFSDKPGACRASLLFEPGTAAPAPSLAPTTRSSEPGVPSMRASSPHCPDMPQTTTDLTGRSHAKTRMLKSGKAPTPGLTHVTIIPLHLNRLGLDLLRCNDLPVIARVTLNREGKQLQPSTPLVKLLKLLRAR